MSIFGDSQSTRVQHLQPRPMLNSGGRSIIFKNILNAGGIRRQFSPHFPQMKQFRKSFGCQLLFAPKRGVKNKTPPKIPLTPPLHTIPALQIV